MLGATVVLCQSKAWENRQGNCVRHFELSFALVRAPGVGRDLLEAEVKAEAVVRATTHGGEESTTSNGSELTSSGERM